MSNPERSVPQGPSDDPKVEDREDKGLRIAVVTISDTRTEATDLSGRVLVEALTAAGHHIVERSLVRDELPEIRAAVRRLIALERVEVVITTGGTGFTERDVTPEALAPLWDRPIPGFGELFRQISYAQIGSSALQSRADAGISGRTLVFMLPGSPNACQTALDTLLLPQLDLDHRPCNFAELVRRGFTRSPAR